jgi:hypothetical protein
MIPISACGKRPPESFGCPNQTHDYTKQPAGIPVCSRGEAAVLARMDG